MTRRIEIVQLRNASDKATRRPGQRAKLTWDELVGMLARHDVRASKDGPGWSPLSMRDGECTCGADSCPRDLGHFTKPNVLALYALVLDIDKCRDGRRQLDQAGAERAIARLRELGLRHVVHSTHSHRYPDRASLRAVIAMSRPVTTIEWPTFFDTATAWLDVDRDPSCSRTIGRFWYLPSVPLNRFPIAHAVEGASLNVDAIMATANPPVQPVQPAQGRPYTHQGEAFDIGEAMSRWLPAKRRASGSGDVVARWHVGPDGCPKSHIHGSKGVPSKSTVFEYASGAWEFICQSTSHERLDHDDFREHYEPGWIRPSRRPAPLPRSNHEPPPARFDDMPPAEPPELAIEITRATPPEGRKPGTFEYEHELALASVRAMSATPEVARQPLFRDASELFAIEFPATSWIVQGLISRGGLALFAAEPKSAKTWIAIEVSVAIATGTLACSEFKTEPGRVAYFFCEDLDRQVRNRVRAVLASRGLSSDALRDRLYVCPRGRFLDLTVDDDLARLIASARRLGPIDLLVLDPLRDLHSAAEDKSDEMGPLMKRLRLIGELLGCTVLVTHHKAKASETNSKRRGRQQMRGSSAIHGSTDSGLYLGIRDGDGRTKFELDVESEVKGARSAGRFGLSLVVTDDAGGEAVHADWTVSREGGEPKTSPKQAAKAAQETSDDELVFRWVRKLAMRGEHFSRRALRDHDEAPIAVKRVTAALDRLIDNAGRLVQVGSKVHLPEPSKGDRS
jgi:hypothetical protein